MSLQDAQCLCHVGSSVAERSEGGPWTQQVRCDPVFLAGPRT